MSATKLKATVNNQALVKFGELASNTVLLGANLFLIGSSVTNTMRFKRQERIQTSLQLGCEIASAAAGLTKVIMEQLGHGKSNQDV